MGRIGELMTRGVPSEFETTKERAYVTFTCLPASRANNNQDSDTEYAKEEPTITLLERRNLICGSRTTGNRTWEAALHLASYLLTDHGHDLIRGKSILELGGGTGFLAILFAKYLGARHVTTTDGDEAVVDYLKENLVLNNIDDEKILTVRPLWWGDELKGTWVEQACSSDPFDLVIGADIVSASTLQRSHQYQSSQKRGGLTIAIDIRQGSYLGSDRDSSATLSDAA